MSNGKAKIEIEFESRFPNLATNLEKAQVAVDDLKKEYEVINELLKDSSLSTADRLRLERDILKVTTKGFKAQDKLVKTQIKYNNTLERFVDVQQDANDAASDYNDISNKGAKNINSLEKANASLYNIRNKLNLATIKGRVALVQINKQIQENVQSLNKYKNSTSKAGAVLGKFSKALGKLGIAGKVISKIVALGVAMFKTFKKLASVAIEFDKIRFSMKKLVTDTSEFIQTNGYLAKTIDNLGMSIKGTTMQYLKFRTAARAVGFTTLQTQDIFTSISKAGAILGQSIDEQRGALKAIEQMMSKGKVAAEELRGQLGERLPGAFNIMASSMGVSNKELDKMLKDGKVIAQEVLPAFARELEKTYGIDQVEKVENLSASSNRLNTSWQRFIGTAVQSDGVIMRTLLKIYDAMDYVVKKATKLIESESQERTRAIGENTQAIVELERKKDKEKAKLAFDAALLEGKTIKDSNKAYEKYLNDKAESYADTYLVLLKEQDAFFTKENIQQEKKNRDDLSAVQEKQKNHKLLSKEDTSDAEAIANSHILSAAYSEREEALKKVIKTREKEKDVLAGNLAAYKVLSENAKGIVDDKVKEAKNVLQVVFREKMLIGLLKEKTAIIKTELNYSTKLAANNKAAVTDRLAALDKVKTLESKLIDESIDQQINKRVVWAEKEKNRYDDALAKHRSNIDAKKSSSLKYYDEEGNRVSIDADYKKQVDEDLQRHISAINIKGQKERFNRDIELTVQEYSIKMEAFRNHIAERQAAEKNAFTLEKTEREAAYADNSWYKNLFTDFYKESKKANKDFTLKTLNNNVSAARETVDKLKAIQDEAMNGENMSELVLEELDLREQMNEAISSDNVALESQLQTQIKVNIEKRKAIGEIVDPVELKKADDAVTEAESKLSKFRFDTAEEWKKTVGEVLAIAGQFNSAITSVFDAFHAKRLSQIEAERNASLEGIEAQMSLSEENSERQTELAKEKDLVNKKYDKEKRKAERDDAKRKKVQALIDIAMNTAVAIMSSIKDMGPIAGPIIVGVLGAIQTAAIIAQPLPPLKLGRKGGPAGLFLTGDGGKREIIAKKNGLIGITPDRDTVTWLDEGDKVYPSMDAYKREMMAMSTSNLSGGINTTLIENAIEKGFNKAKINNKTIVNTKIDLNHELWKANRLNF